MSRHTSRITILLTAGLLAAGCATAPAASPGRAPAPEPVTTEPAPDDLLAPSAAALRTAETIELTGLELGKMWTFQDPPLGWWEEQYDFVPDAGWLEHVQLASLRYGEHCSASFVSPDGLVMTNHHCARDCVEAVSPEGEDYVEDGFYAATRDQELTCPGLYLEQLHSVEDVTDRVLAAGRDLTTDTAKARARTEVADAIDEACEAETGQKCQVVSLYHGGRFHLYRYRRYEPVKLVFAPELAAAFFGGEPDNFTYPRHALDVSFVRAYEDEDTPVRTDRWFAWDADGAQEDEAVFIVGNPGGTSRLLTVSQIMYEKERYHPFVVQYLGDYRELLHWIADLSPQAERSVREQLFGIENSLKAYTGQLEGLRDTVLVGRKIRWEAEIRSAVNADPELRAEFGDVWDRLAGIQAAKIPDALRTSIYNIGFIGDPQIGMAGQLIRYVRESAKPADERGEDYGAEQLSELESQLLGPSPVNPEIATRLLAVRLRLARNFLPADDPFVAAAFRNGESPEAAASRIVRDTRIMDPAFRKKLIEGGMAAVEAEGDIGVRIARILDGAYPALTEKMEELEAAETVQEERLARAIFAVKGTSIPPDATFTLRITDGKVAGYPYNGTVAPPQTSYWGIFGAAANFGNEFPFALPGRFEAARDRIDMGTPLNFVTTNDITGGNSGSPMLSTDATVVGVAFDGNIESLPNEWLYDEEAARTVGVHSAGILEALRSIYEAEALVEELMAGGQ